MNSMSICAAALVTAAATAGAVSWWIRPVDATPASTVDLEARFVEIEGRLRDLGQRLEQADRLQTTAPQRAAAEVVDPAVIDAAVARYLAANGKGSTKPPAATAPLTREQALAKLAEVGGRVDRLNEVWPEIVKAGLEEAMLTHLRGLADADPRDAVAQYQYGSALIASLQDKPTTKQGPAAMAADAAFDRALEADPEHWGARFTKATSLSFWPKITGKHVEAIKHFEILAQQQERGAAQPQHVQTYLYLGNLHAANGDKVKAEAAYERGLRWFPDHAELKKQRAGIGK
jgi:tetratricopeptide (TPR) repeat protein